jgi:hypothetical protein
VVPSRTTPSPPATAVRSSGPGCGRWNPVATGPRAAPSPASRDATAPGTSGRTGPPANRRPATAAPTRTAVAGEPSSPSRPPLPGPPPASPTDSRAPRPAATRTWVAPRPGRCRQRAAPGRERGVGGARRTHPRSGETSSPEPDPGAGDRHRGRPRRHTQGALVRTTSTESTRANTEGTAGCLRGPSLACGARLLRVVPPGSPTAGAAVGRQSCDNHLTLGRSALGTDV